MNKKTITLLFLVALLVLPSSIADAKAKQVRKCCGKDGLYGIAYDEEKNSQVNLDKITCDDIVVGHLPYPSEVEDEAYQFTAVRIGSMCKDKGNGKFSTCPKKSSVLTDIGSTYIKKDGVTNKIKIEVSGNAFNITITDAFKDKYRIRYSVGDGKRNADNKNADAFNDFLSKGADGKWHIYGVPGNAGVIVEFYMSPADADCGNAFIRDIVFYTPNLEELKVDNEMLNTTECKNFIKWYPVYKNGSPLPEKNYKKSEMDALKKQMVPYCYEKKVLYRDVSRIHDETLAAIQEFKKWLGGFEEDDNNGNIMEDDNGKLVIKKAKGSRKCEQASQGDSYVTSWYGLYWGYVCVENYYSEGDTAKLVHAGDGFTYESTFTVTRNCEPIRISYSPGELGTCDEVHYPEYCQDCSCDCTWVGASGETHTGTEAGPNATFDQCINKCDGGKYSQSCINSCYQSVYNKSRDLSLTTGLSLNNKKQKTQFVLDISPAEGVADGSITTESGVTTKGLPGTTYTYHVKGSDKVCQCTESFWCQAGHGSCTFHTWTYVCGVLKGYCRKLDDRQEAEKELVEEVINKPEEILVDTSKFSMTIKDNYTGADIKYTESSSPALNVKIVERTAKKAVVKVSLPLSYVEKTTGDAVYRSNDSAKTVWKLDTKNRTLVSSKWLGNSAYYFDKGDRKYYTNLNSTDLNIIRTDKANIKLAEQSEATVPDNIKVSSGTKGNGALGLAKYGSDLTCYYGVYNGFTNNNPPCSPPDEVCGEGLQFIFRPIDLGDVFPNGRAPRYNWSASAKSAKNKYENHGYKLYQTAVDPVTYAKNIEKKKDSIYKTSSGEIDYEFILTPQNIAAIKKYNSDIANNKLAGASNTDFNHDGDRNYLDYDMYCYTNGAKKEVCVSKFLDNTDIVTYGNLDGTHQYTVNARKSIVGCNNAKDNGTTCDTGAHK